jgi:hypothetical protein
VGLEARKYTKTHKKTGSDKHSKHPETHKPPSPGKQDTPYSPPPSPDNAYPAPDNAYPRPAPGDSYKWWRKHDAEQKHEYKTGGGYREPQQPWGEYAPREAYGEFNQSRTTLAATVAKKMVNFTGLIYLTAAVRVAPLSTRGQVVCSLAAAGCGPQTLVCMIAHKSYND